MKCSPAPWEAGFKLRLGSGGSWYGDGGGGDLSSLVGGMKLQCEVEVISRLLPTCGLRGRGKGSRALLSIGRQPRVGGGGSAVYLLICTQKDKAGARYKLQENIEQFFTKFVEEGKATVRLKEPAVDVCLSKANAIILKSFLSAVRLANQGCDVDTLPLSSLTPAKSSEIEKPRTKMVITSKRDYPLTKCFPYSLEHLQTSYCKLARVDMRMLCLKKLRKLDLSHNHIKKLPATIGDLVCLQELNLHNNHLEEFPVALCISTLQKSLQFLDLSQNKIKALPIQFCQLQELVHLKLDDNELIRFPVKFGQLNKLRFLSAARNKLPFLPESFKRLSLDNLDLFGNAFEKANPLVPSIHLTIPLTLLESAARATINYRIPFGPNLIPANLCEELEVAKSCDCGKSCLSCYIQATVTMNLHHVSHTVVLVDNMGGTEASILCYFCSLTCYSQFLDKYLQSNR